MATSSTTAIIAALAANLGVAVAKFVGYVFTGSSSMLAEAIHSVADTTNEGLLLLGGGMSRRSATPQHPFGFGRERYFWAFIVSLVLFTVGGVFAILEGFEKLAEPNHAVENVGWAIGILLVAMVLEGSSLRTGKRQSAALKADASWWQFIRHSRNPELPVVLLEDFGALIGLAFAIAGVSLSAITGNSRWDAYGTIAIGVLLVAVAAVLVVEMKSLLIGESARQPMQKSIVSAIEGTDTVVRVIHMRTEHLGPEELLIGAKVEFERSLDVEALAGAINRVEANVRSAVPIEHMIYIEPDFYVPGMPEPDSQD